MSLTVSDSGGGNFKPAPAGTHVARCVRLIDLGLQPGSKQFPGPKHKILVTWELPNELVEFEKDGEKVSKPALIMSRYTANLGDKANLRKDLESWRGKKFTPEELRGFDLKNVLDKACMLAVIHSDDGKYANVQGVSGLVRGMECPPRVHDLVYYELKDREGGDWNKLTEKMQGVIKASESWQGEPPKSSQEFHDDEAPTLSDDDIPF